MNAPKSVTKHFSDKVDLGKSPEKPMPGSRAVADEPDAKKYYPSLYLSDLPSSCKCKAGDEGHALVRYKVKSTTVRDEDSGEEKGEGHGDGKKSMDLEIHHIHFPGDDSSEENDGGDDNGLHDGKMAASMAKLMKSQG